MFDVYIFLSLERDLKTWIFLVFEDLFFSGTSTAFMTSLDTFQWVFPTPTEFLAPISLLQSSSLQHLGGGNPQRFQCGISIGSKNGTLKKKGDLMGLRLN